MVSGKAKLWVIAALVPFLLFGAYESSFGNQLSRIQKHFQMLDRQSSSERAR
jgi:hypothetical protein